MADRRDHPQEKMRPMRIFLRPKKVDASQKRSSERTSTDRGVSLQRLGGAGKADARLVNLSTTGVQFTTLLVVENGVDVELEVLPEQWLTATIRWHRPDGDGVIVGAEWKNPIPAEDVWKIRSHAEQ